MIKNECVESAGIIERRVKIVESVKSLKEEFPNLNGSGLKNLDRVVLAQSVIDTEDSESVRNCRMTDHWVGQLNQI